jgi:hypothetical protein
MKKVTVNNMNNNKYYQQHYHNRDIVRQQGYPLMFVTYKIKAAARNEPTQVSLSELK